MVRFEERIAQDPKEEGDPQIEAAPKKDGL
jgi:hypothetical protein